MALIGENGLHSLVTPPSTDNPPASREIDNRSQGSGRAGRADAPGARGGGESGASGVVVDLSPAARNVVETGSLAVRAADTAPAANDGLSALRGNGAASADRESAEAVQAGPDGDGDADDRLAAARANDRRASDTAAAARNRPTPTGRAGSRFDLTI
ncbi:MAG: hypothetical protein D6757_03185 [Alphaproteobacteria bacterium]|nr:MAG: hypothetical protein D6757_03185 [Alphaproteobacteria bacterium]